MDPCYSRVNYSLNLSCVTNCGNEYNAKLSISPPVTYKAAHPWDQKQFLAQGGSKRKSVGQTDNSCSQVSNYYRPSLVIESSFSCELTLCLEF